MGLPGSFVEMCQGIIPQVSVFRSGIRDAAVGGGAVCGDPGLRVGLSHSVICAVCPSAGHVARLGGPRAAVAGLCACARSGGRVTREVA